MFNRVCKLSINKGVSVNTSTDNFLDVKFHVKNSVNMIHGGATIEVCGLKKSNVNALMDNFIQGVTFQKDEKTVVTLEAGYSDGPGACVEKIYTGTAWDAKLYGTPDMWLKMNCLANSTQTNVASSLSFNSPLKFHEACTKICQTLMGVDCEWAVTDEEVEKVIVPKWSSDILKERTDPDAIANHLEELSGRRVKCWVDDDKQLTPIVVTDKKFSKASYEKIQSVCQLSQQKFSCTGEGKYDSLVYGIPQLTVNGLNLDIQLNPKIRRGQIFTVDSAIIPKVNGKSYAIIAFEHIGHLRGNEWKTHIEGLILDQKAYLQ